MNHEVKLVLCDLDGTILDSEKRIPRAFYDVFAQLKEKGIFVGMATGRPVSNIELKFAEVKGHLCNVSENGGCVTYKGKIIHSEQIAKELCDKVVLKARELKDCGAVLCALHATYIENRDEQMVKTCKEYYPNLKMVDDLLGVEDTIIKISIRDFIDSKTHVGPAIENLDERLENASSGKHWVDIMNKGMSKGKGIDILCQYMGITSNNVMAFGDEMNDYQMLEKVKYSYAMGNAIPPIKKICVFQCESNDEDGVIKTLKREFELK